METYVTFLITIVPRDLCFISILNPVIVWQEVSLNVSLSLDVGMEWRVSLPPLDPAHDVTLQCCQQWMFLRVFPAMDDEGRGGAGCRAYSPCVLLFRHAVCIQAEWRK